MPLLNDPYESIPRMPGPRLGVGRMTRLIGPRIDRVLELDRFQRLAIALETRLPDRAACHGSEAGIEVWFDGYLSDVVGGVAGDPQRTPAATIAALFSRDGIRALPRLRGSYTVLIWQARRRQALLFNDRRGSRPVFLRSEGVHAIALAPTVAALHPRTEPALALDIEGIAELALSGGFSDRRTLFRDVQRLPPASCLEIDADGHRITPYWQPSIGDFSAARDQALLIDELHELLRQAVARTLRIADRPVLLLSGGLDSRLLLGTLLESGQHDIPIASFRRGEEGEDDDAAIARRVGAELGLSTRNFAFTEGGGFGAMQQTARMYDCRAEVVDVAPPRVMRELAGQYGTFISGDEFPGRGNHVGSVAAALRSVHFHPLTSIPWLAQSWLRRPVRDRIRSKRRELAGEWLRAFGRPEPDQFKDLLFFRDRVGNFANALAGGKLRYLEQARPLLDEDIVDFLFRLPPETRFGKRLLHGVMERYHPRLHRLPYARQGSVSIAEQCRHKLYAMPGYSDTLITRMLDEMDSRLAAMLDRDALRAFIAAVAREGSIRAVPYNRLGRLPGAWRWQRHPRSADLNPLAALMRLLQVNLYLTGLATRAAA